LKEPYFAGYYRLVFAARAKTKALLLLMRVPNRFFGIRDLAYFKAGIRDFEGKGERDSGLSF